MRRPENRSGMYLVMGSVRSMCLRSRTVPRRDVATTLLTRTGPTIFQKQWLSSKLIVGGCSVLRISGNRNPLNLSLQEHIPRRIELSASPLYKILVGLDASQGVRTCNRMHRGLWYEETVHWCSTRDRGNVVIGCIKSFCDPWQNQAE